jgi:Protein of unknown function (DUF3108)
LMLKVASAKLRELMPSFRLSRPVAWTVLLILSSSLDFAPAQQSPAAPRTPIPQKLTYRIEWRLVTAGTANLEFQQRAANEWQTNLNLESTGLVSRLYRVLDKYSVVSNGQFCPSMVSLDAQEGKKHTLTRLTFDGAKHKVDYEEQDLIKDSQKKQQTDLAPCTHEIVGALAALGQLDLPLGTSATMPVTNGKKMVYAKIEAQTRETVNIEGKSYQAIRYEAFLFDNVLYKRKGRLFLWITDDPARLPVQFRFQLGFPIGTISLVLEKQTKP